MRATQPESVVRNLEKEPYASAPCFPQWYRFVLVSLHLFIFYFFGSFSRTFIPCASLTGPSFPFFYRTTESAAQGRFLISIHQTATTGSSPITPLYFQSVFDKDGRGPCNLAPTWSLAPLSRPRAIMNQTTVELALLAAREPPSSLPPRCPDSWCCHDARVQLPQPKMSSTTGGPTAPVLSPTTDL